MFCGTCGQQLKEGWQACPRCGAVRSDDGEPAVARRSRRPLVIGGAAALALLLVIGGLLILRNGSSKKTATHGRVVTSSAHPSPALSPSLASSSTGPKAATDTATTHQATSTASQALPSPSGPSPIHLSGTGKSTSALFNAVGGLTVFRAHCTCQSNFVVELLDAKGASQGTLVNVPGRYDGSIGKHLAAGSYQLKVDADHRWDVYVEQPRNHHGDRLPHSYAGRGQQIVGPFQAGSAVHLDAHNTGSGNFVVEVLSSDGERRDVAFNKVGNFSGSTVSNGLSGSPYYLNVDSDGTWTITVSTP